MKIPSTSGPSRAERRTVERRSSDGGFASLFEAAPPPNAVGPGTPLMSTGAILTVQEIAPREPEGRRDAVARGHELLDELKELHLGLINGWISEGELHRLAHMVDEARPATDDPRLASVLDDIETRAAVEIAKLRR